MTGIKIDGTQNKVVLDDDADTYLEAATDDTIKVYVAGAQDFTITANTLTAESGSTITGPTVVGSTSIQTPLIEFTDGDNAISIADGGGVTIATSLDMNGTELILDADADTSITADTDDQIDFRLGGVDEITMSSSGIVINEGSNDRDFRIESNGNTHMLFVDGGNDHVSIGATTLESGDVLGVNDSGANSTIARFTNTNADEHGVKIIMQKSTASPADGDEIAELLIQGKDDAGNDNAYANIQFFSDDVSNSSEDGSIAFGAIAGGTFAEKVRIVGNKVGFGVATPQAGLDIERDDTVLRGTNASSTANYQNMRLFSAVGGTGTETFRIENDGDVKNTNNSYGSISDERIKQNITDASSQWDDIKALKIRNYKRKDQVAAGLDITMIGVIAQELETAGMNGLVKESPPGTGEIRANSVFGTIEEVKSYYISTDIEVEKGTKSVGDVKQTTYKENPSDVEVKSVKYSVLYMKAIKALQEAQTRIETLETKVAALEG